MPNTNNRNTRKFKSMNCNPKNKNKTISNKSCFTKSAILTVIKSYNKHHSSSINTSLPPSKLWGELKNKLKDCDKEDCWLKTIKENTIRKKLDEELFAPDQPSEWKENPSAWLSNYDILNVLKQHEEADNTFKFIGPTPIDFDSKPYNDNTCVWKDLCTFQLQKHINNGITKIGVVFNLDEHDEPGSHWTSLFIDLKQHFIFYLDSAGSKMPSEVETLVKRIVNQGLYLKCNPIKFTFYENHSMMTHQKGDNECGMYSLYFIITMLTNKASNRKKPFKNLQDKMDYFLKERIPDKFVFQKRKEYFNV